MTRRCLAGCLLFAAFSSFPALAGTTVEGAVTYVVGSSSYVDIGSDEGLRVGDELDVLRGDAVVATLTVTEVTNRRASCTAAEGSPPIESGDSVRFRLPGERPAGPAAAVTMAPAKSDSRPRRLRGAGIHGRIGVRFLTVRDRTDLSAQYSQPGLDLRLDGDRIGGSNWGLAADVRTRRTYRDFADGTSDDDARSRVYRANLSWDGANTPWRFALGRQFSPTFASVSVFDGLSADYRRERWSTGFFSGTQPDPYDYGYSSDIKEHGVYFQYRGRPAPRKSWAVTTGLVGSYQESEINREFLYVQGRYGGRKLSAYATSELDVNRDWRKDAGESGVELTSGFFSLHYRLNETVTLRGGFDDRRNVRLYRDHVTPETDFDDTFRRGGWAGVHVRLGNRYGFGLDARSNSGGDAGTASSYTGTFGVSRLTSMNLRLHARATSYSNDRLEGWLYSVSAGLDAGPGVGVQVSGGVRDESNLSYDVFDDTMTWFGVDVDVSLGRRWFLIFSGERTSGDFEEVDQFFTRLSYRF